jgi:uncharacterized protein
VHAEGTWLDQVVARLELAPVYRFETVIILPMSIAMFLVGAKLMRAGVFEHSDRGARLRRRLMVLG